MTTSTSLMLIKITLTSVLIDNFKIYDATLNSNSKRMTLIEEKVKNAGKKHKKNVEL